MYFGVRFFLVSRREVIMGFILFIVSLVLGCLIVPLMILINSFIYIINLDFIGLNDYLMRMAIGKDQNGGVAGDRTFNFYY